MMDNQPYQPDADALRGGRKSRLDKPGYLSIFAVSKISPF